MQYSGLAADNQGLSDENSAFQKSMRDEIKACTSISNSADEMTEPSLLIFLIWKKQDLFICFTWVPNDED